ncbi:hypothetical protein J6590_012489 [Homalodisca vitripennis]|nr:hypothetical protein J6590_012489 [Homalodisca vitripennis]
MTEFAHHMDDPRVIQGGPSFRDHPGSSSSSPSPTAQVQVLPFERVVLDENRILQALQEDVESYVETGAETDVGSDVDEIEEREDDACRNSDTEQSDEYSENDGPVSDDEIPLAYNKVLVCGSPRPTATGFRCDIGATTPGRLMESTMELKRIDTPHVISQTDAAVSQVTYFLTHITSAVAIYRCVPFLFSSDPVSQVASYVWQSSGICRGNPDHHPHPSTLPQDTLHPQSTQRRANLYTRAGHPTVGFAATLHSFRCLTLATVQGCDTAQ